MRVKKATLYSAVIVALLGLIIPSAAYAGFGKVKINVVGMTCEFCERALEKNLARVPGVESARAWLDKGIAEVKLKNGAKLDVEKLSRAVKDGGLTLKDIEITVSGKLIEEDKTPALKVSESNQVLKLKFTSKENPQGLDRSNVIVSARISAENVKSQAWDVKEIKRYAGK